MKAKSVLGWVMAAVLGLGWLGSTNDKTKSPDATLIERTADPAKPADPAPTPVRTSTTTSTSLETPAEAQSEILYTRSNVRLRQGPSTSTSIVWTVPRGTQVLATDREGLWRRVRVVGREGWLHSDFLTKLQPAIIKPKAIALVPVPVVPKMQSRSRAGQPVRDAYVGTCDCPYDRMRNGRACGGRSAYSRPGGRSPQCYF